MVVELRKKVERHRYQVYRSSMGSTLHAAKCLPVSFGTVPTFHFSLKEIQDCDFTRFREKFAPETIQKSVLPKIFFGATRFPLLDIVKGGAILPDSSEFVNFCQQLRSEPGYTAVTNLKTPDYFLAIAMSLPDVIICRRSASPFDINIKAGQKDIMGAFVHDEERAREFCNQAGILRAYKMANHWAKIRLYFIRSFWPS